VNGPISVYGDGAKIEDGRGAQKDICRCEQLANGDAKQPATICIGNKSQLGPIL